LFFIICRRGKAAMPLPKTLNKVDAASGLLFVSLGLIFGIKSLGMELGSPLRMGPGYFPLFLSGLLIAFGVLIIASAFKSTGEALGKHAWRGLFFILPAPVFFGLTVRGLGFVPSIFLTTLIAAKASMKMSMVSALLLALGVTVFSTLVFSFALGLPFQSFGPWLSFIGFPS
jgi:hypothetical protein